MQLKGLRIPGWFVLMLGVTLGSASAPAQGTKADYDRAGQLRELTRGKVFRDRVQPHWFHQNQRFWYRNDLADGAKEFLLVELDPPSRRPAFDHTRLAQALREARGVEVDPARLPFDEIRFGETLDSFQFSVDGQTWHCHVADYSLRQENEESHVPDATRNREGPGEDDANEPRRRGRSGGRLPSPDGRYTAYIQDHNVVVRDEEENDDFSLSTDGAEGDEYGPRFYWSPDSSMLVALKTREGTNHQVHLIESSPRDQLQPRLHSMLYRKPGDAIPVTKPHLFHMRRRGEIPLDDALFANPWNIREIRWAPDSSRFTFLYNQRGHQVLRVVEVEAASGRTRAVIEETSPTFIDYAHKTFTHYVEATGEIIWMSERDGWNHLYLYDALRGEVMNRVTEGPWVVRGVDRVDEEAREIWFRAGGIHPGQDPYFIHHARVRFDGTGLVILTEGDGTHEIEFSPDRSHYLDRWSRVDQAPLTELRRSCDGALVLELERADDTALRSTGWVAPEPFVAKGRDGQTDIHGVIYRPMQLDPSRHYPVVEHIYAGPQGSYVPKGFRSYYPEQSLAELGFIVVEIDGMGTSNRSKSFHDVCWQNLKDAGLPDRIAWMKAAAAAFPYMDLDRVGIYGGSAGGQNTVGALLFHPEFYKVGVADCGCHDNRMDKIWWNELWMGWPVGPHYADNSNVTHADKLQGKLFLTVAELDRNVDPASTLQVVDALIRAGKDFDFLMVPGAGHGVGDGSPYMVGRRNDYFVRHLLGVEPRRD